MQQIAKEKIADAELFEFASSTAADPAETRSVIIELQSSPLVPATSGKLTPPSFSLHMVKPQRLERGSAKMDRLEQSLAALDLSKKPVRLNSAQAFVVEVTPSQLRSIVDWRLTGLVRPNRTHRVPRSVAHAS